MDIVREYLYIFLKSKYDVDRISIESQRVFLKSDFPMSLRPYRTYLLEKKENF